MEADGALLLDGRGPDGAGAALREAAALPGDLGAPVRERAAADAPVVVER
ncbi:hypothetical protein ABZ622_26105 [Streptomyces sp. NPDC007164]